MGRVGRAAWCVCVLQRLERRASRERRAKGQGVGGCWRACVCAGHTCSAALPPNPPLATAPPRSSQQMALFRQQAKDVDIIITTALIPGKKAPLLITKVCGAACRARLLAAGAPCLGLGAAGLPASIQLELPELSMHTPEPPLPHALSHRTWWRA